MVSAPPRRIVVGLSGATGAIYGVRLLQVLREIPGVESHLVLSAPGKKTLAQETDFAVKDVEALAHAVYDNRDIGCALASGSFRTAGMAVVPCSIKTAACVANSITDTLIARAADVTLKEGRTLVLVVRETPLHRGHLRQLLTLAELGAIVLPPMPAFYLRPTTIDEIVDHTVGRVLDRLGLPHRLVPEWNGPA
jgi:4-hydroxy-3-polyprenylbenzoate decarboxylase